MDSESVRLQRSTASGVPFPVGLLQRKCACGNHTVAGGQCEECRSKGRFALQPKPRMNRPGDSLEQEADRVAERVLAAPSRPPAGAASAAVQRLAGDAGAGGAAVPDSVGRVLASGGRPLQPALRQDMEGRFGRDFSAVRVHTGPAADESAREVNAEAYTVGRHIAFAAAAPAPATPAGRRLLAHELTHVIQQTGGGGGLLQRQPAPAPKRKAGNRPKTEAHYQQLVKQGKWCRDSEKSGELHPGLQCYREIPSPQGYPAGDQVCFSKDTGKFVESSPDFVSAVSGQNKDGTCNIPLGITDPPQPATQRGRRALGHLIADIATEDPDLIGRHAGRIMGLSMGIALPKDSLDSDLAPLLVPLVLGYVGGKLGERGLPVLHRWARRHGFLPTLGFGVGSNLGLGVGVGVEQRDKPLPRIPVNSYLTLGFDSSLAFGGEAGTASTFQAKVGIRLDPGSQGGLFGTAAVGAGLAAGGDVSAVASGQFGVGLRATDFLDVEVVRESVVGSGDAGTTYWLTLRLVAPRRVFQGHGKKTR